jgi:hypothetical protein
MLFYQGHTNDVKNAEREAEEWNWALKTMIRILLQL